MVRKRSPFFTWRGAILQSTLPATTKHVLLTLSCHMNDAGEECYPSVELLCRETGLGRTSVKAQLKHAAEQGWIEIGKHGFGDQRWARNEYRIKWPDEAEGGPPRDPPSELEGGSPSDPPSCDKVGHVVTEGGSLDVQKVGHHVTPSTSVSTSVSTPVGLDPVAWQMWETYRRKIRKPLKPVSVPAAQRKLAAFGSEQRAVVENCIAQGYQGLYAPKGNGGGSGRRKTFDEIHREQSRRIAEAEEAKRETTDAIPGSTERVD